MAKIRLITASEIVNSTPLSGNTGIDRYVYLIDDVQIIVLEPILGTKLYNKIITDFDNNTISGIYLQLLDDYIKPMLIHSVFAEYVEIGAFRIRNNGNVKHSPDNSENLSTRETETFSTSQRNKATTYMDRMQKFLCDQRSNLPEYKNQDNKYDIESQENKGFSIGWYIDGVTHKKDVYSN